MNTIQLQQKHLFCLRFSLNLDCFDHGEDYIIQDTCITKEEQNDYEKCKGDSNQSDGKCQKKLKTCQMTNNAKVCEPSTAENTVSQNLY